jgi:hypothetical protein
MKEAAAFFNQFKTNLISGLNTCAIGRIEAFDGVKMKADVRILPDDVLIVDVPVGTLQTSDFYIRLPYKKGDYVFVSFAQRDIDGIMHGGDATPSERMLSLDDAVVICGINLFTQSLPPADADKLVIGEKNGAAKIVIGGGKIRLIGDIEVNGTPLQAGGDDF